MPLSTKQMEYLALAWSCFETEPKIDYDKFHKVAGLASAHSARELMRVTKNKLKSEYGTISEGVQDRNSKASSNTSTPKVSKTAPRKRTAAGPAPTAKAKKQKGSEIDAEQSEDDDLSIGKIKEEPGSNYFDADNAFI